MLLRHLAPIGLALITGAALANTTPAAKAKSEPARATTKSEPAVTGRDWSKIDTNKDGYISPEEMEAFLAANPGPLRTASKS